LFNVLVLGRTGQLAQALARCQPRGWKIHFADRAEIDLASPVGPANVVAKRKPTLVINAAAYTAVDKAETESDLAMRINAEAPAAIARACARIDIPFITLSSDYVFDGTKRGAYVEEDKACPISAYGRSKALGEDLVRAATDWHLIVRTSWVFSATGQNFVRTMLRLAKELPYIRVVADQYGRPTAANDLAAAIVLAAHRLLEDRMVSGTYHVANAGVASWCEFATSIFEGARARCMSIPSVQPISSCEFPTAARRPTNSELATEKFERVFNKTLRPWREPLVEVLDQLVPPPPTPPQSDLGSVRSPS
jgi:dTDP-4-dehydrorhamnose reductase